MAWRPLFRPEIDVEVIKRQLAPCLSAIIQHSAVAEDFEDFHGRLEGLPSMERAQQLLNFIGNRRSDEEFMHRIWQALDRKELKGILRVDSMGTISPTSSPFGTLTQDRSTSQSLADPAEQERQRRERREIADWLSPLNFKASQIDHLQKRHGDSGNWFLEHQEFKDWRDGGPGTLWCPGSPGAGKTVLAAITTDHLQTVYKDDDVSITWIYCNYKEKAEQTTGNLVGSLLKQMVQNKSSISNKIMALYERHHIDRTRPPLGELERALNAEFTTYSNAFVIVDAVDECPEDTGTQTEFLEVLQTFSRTVKVLITSRDIPRIEQWFGSERMIRIEARDEDVRRYIQGRIDRKRKRHLKILESKIVSKVAERAGGMFLFVRLLMDSIEVKVNAAGVISILEDMPKGIDGIYADALQRIREQDEEQAQLGEQVLKWITFAFRPLSIGELQEALAAMQEFTSINPEVIIDEEILTSACAGLISVDKGEWEEWGRVRLIHYTAQDYFDHMRNVHFPGAHIDIAKACITYLSQDALLGVKLGDSEDLLAHYDLLDYAGRSWGDHVREQSDEECDEMVLQFLEDEKKFLLSGQISQFYHGLEFTGVHLSSLFGLEHILKIQLGKGANPNQPDNQGQTPLAWGAVRGHEKVVQILLMQSNVEDINLADIIGQTPLMMAAINGHVNVVELLLAQQNVNINFADKGGWTPLMWAAVNGHVDVVELLLAQPTVDTNLVNEHGQTLLMMEAGYGHVYVVELLLALPNVDINLADVHGWTPLMSAAGNGHVDVVELLLALPSVDINLANKYGQTPLMFAAGNGHVNVVELLLALPNVDINLADKHGQTSLMMASKNGYVNVVELLLAQPNVVNMANEYGWTPLMISARNGHVGVVQLLLAQPNVNINFADEHGQTPLMLAAGNGHVNVVELLLAKPSVESNLADEDGSTSLMMAAENGHMNIVELLLAQLNVDVNLANQDGWTPLMMAAKNGHVNVVKLLVTQSNIAMNLTNESWAANKSLPKVVRLLLGQLNLEVHLGHGLITLYLAVENRHMKLVEFLLDQPNVAIDNKTLLSSTYLNVNHKKLDVSLAHALEHKGCVQCVCFSADGNYLATACNDTVRIQDVKTGVEICNLVTESTVNSSAYIYSLCFSADGKHLVTGGDDALIKIWDIADKSIWRIFEGHEGRVWSVDFSRDGRFIVSGSWDETARIWDMKTSEHRVLLVDPNKLVWFVAISPDGQLVATASDYIIHIWDTQSGVQIERLHHHLVLSVAFTPDGKGLVSGGWDGTVKHWDVSAFLCSPLSVVPLSEPYNHSKPVESEKGSVCMATFEGHNSTVYSVALSQDGQWVVSGSDDGSVRFWNLHTKQAELLLWGHERPVNSVDLSPTGGILSTGSDDGSVKLWSYAWG